MMWNLYCGPKNGPIPAAGRRQMNKIGLFLFCGAAGSLWLPGVAASEVTSLGGEIEGAEYAILLPETHNGRVLLLAHGYWPESMPSGLSGDWSDGLAGSLVEDGWIVATTSYRRNGWVMEDAATDLENLYELVASATHGDPGTVYLMGDSMGGGIVTLLAENPGGRFDGALAMGAYLFGPIGAAEAESTELGAHFSKLPEIPILYLTNRSELEGPASYVAAAAEAPVSPVLWKVERGGHVNLNNAEQSAALAALVDWVESGVAAPSKDGTIVMKPESTAEISDGSARGVVSRRVPVYGNFITSFVRDDAKALGIKLGERFELTVAGETVSVLMGESYSDVEVGDWVGFWEAGGQLLICRNYKNAVKTLGVEPGTEVVIRAGD